MTKNNRQEVRKCRTDLRFKRTAQGIVDVLKIDGQLDVVVETDHANSQRGNNPAA